MKNKRTDTQGMEARKDFTASALSAMYTEKRELTIAKELESIYGIQNSVTGINVTPDIAMRFSPYWRAVNIVAGMMGSLPLARFTKEDDDTRTSKPGGVMDLVANQYMSAQTVRETIQGHAMPWGNGYGLIIRNGMGEVKEIIPLMPDRTEPVFRRHETNPALDNKLWYKTRIQSLGETRYLPAADVLHIKGLGYDGIKGYPVVQYNAEAIALGIAAHSFTSSFFGNGTSVSGILTHPNTIKPETHKRLRESWEDTHQGVGKTQKTAILEDGMTFVPISTDPKNAQMIDTLRFSVEDVSRITGVPVHMLAENTRSTFNNIEELNMEFYQLTMLQWFTRWETECKIKLAGVDSDIYYEFNAAALLRANQKARNESYNVAIAGGFMTPNEARKKENLPALKDGNNRRIPSNFAEITPEGDIIIYTSASDSEPEPTGEPNPFDTEGGDTEDDDARAKAEPFRSILQHGFEKVCNRWSSRKQRGKPAGHWHDKIDKDIEALRSEIGPILDSIGEAIKGSAIDIFEQERIGIVTKNFTAHIGNEWRDSISVGEFPSRITDSNSFDLVTEIESIFGDKNDG